MSETGSGSPEIGAPLWLLAELTYACPLQCPYCSNPLDFVRHRDELDTESWVRVLGEARALGAVQLGFSGGEPLARRDLETLVASARALGFYTNLITSAVGMDAERARRLREAGLDHVQISFQAGEARLNDALAGTSSFDHKVAMAREAKSNGLALGLNFVLHRHNIDAVGDMLELAGALDADQVELANAQYYGWALRNRALLLPRRDQLERAERIAERYRRRWGERMKIFYVVPDYFEGRPKACTNGWGRLFLAVGPDGVALPCQGARDLPGIDFPNVRDHALAWIWRESPAFNRFRGEGWMKEPCRSCPERGRDFGGCRCQAYLLTGDAANADPACDKSPHHAEIRAAVESSAGSDAGVEALLARNPVNSRASFGP